MLHWVRRPNFIRNHLDPASRLGEVLFGLIMVLSATLTASLSVSDGEEGVRALLVAALGCNVAWGIIDGVMYVMDSMQDRSGRARLIVAIRDAPSREAALEILRDEVGSKFDAVSERENREALVRSMLDHLVTATPTPTTMIRGDLYGALACFLLVTLACLPASLPFLVFSDPSVALRASNVVSILSLFVVGMKWGEETHTHRLGAGTAMVVLGLALVGIAVLLGG